MSGAENYTARDSAGSGRTGFAVFVYYYPVTMKIVLIILLSFPAAAAAGTPKYSAVDGALAVPLAADNSYFRAPGTAAPDYWNLSSFYVPQFNGSSCSAASVVMALNALVNVRRARGDEEKNIEQQPLLEKISGVKWKELLSEAGYEGRHGVTLEQLGLVSREALALYGGAGFSVQVTTVTGEPSELAVFRRALSGNEKNPNDIMLLHFAQDALTGAPGGPYAHVSPVGAYDAKTRRVLVFDVDREWYEPYWAQDTQVLKAMAVKTKAFGYGGYVVLKVAK